MSCEVCASVAAVHADEVPEAVARCAGADLVEIRLDALEDPTSLDRDRLAAWVEGSLAPVIFTCRPRREGGGYDGAESDREALLRRAAGAHAAYVDVELDAECAASLINDLGCGVILSHHWDVASPADLDDRRRQAQALQPAIVKLVAPAARLVDSLPFLEAGARLVREGQPATAFCMGEAGRPSRALVARYGGALTYATPRSGEGTAPGQWTIDDLAQELRFATWAPGARPCGLIGDPIGHSLSPRILNAAFADAGTPYCYVPLPSADVEDALAFAEAQDFRGLSVTMPFKRAALERCVEVEPLARRIGAVNTLVREADGWHGANTDARAVVESIAAVRPVAGARVTILGAGGAARAAAVALADAGAEIEVLNRTSTRAAEVAALVDGRSGSLSEFARGARDVVVNATPVGMKAEGAAVGGGGAVQTPVPTADLRGDEVVLDMVYRPLDTALLRGARERGCDTVSGLEMLVRQAAEQFRIWTGGSGSLATMRAAASRKP